MLEELKKAKEIAIDLEHNDMRSYIGMVCLMQVSTREKDWIIDTLKPWRENLQILNEVFADPSILKVFHGSSMDMIWLQRDLGLYVVGLFDTFHAACALHLRGKGLKHLLQQYANFEAQKQFQLADWRIRPLPAELIDYARSDTHYLLYIYDNMRNQLVEASTSDDNLIDYVLGKSKEEALQVYVRPVYDYEEGKGQLGWLNLLLQRTVRFSNEQLGVFRAVHAWRDTKARDQDEGVQFILANKFIWPIAEMLPTKPYEFHLHCRGNIQSFAQHLPELCVVVKRGIEEGKSMKPFHEIMQQIGLIAPRPRHLTWKKEPETTIGGMAATLQQVHADNELEKSKNHGTQETQMQSNAPLDYDGTLEEPVAARSALSGFWGVISPHHTELSPEAATAISALSSVLPLPRASDQSMDLDEPVSSPTLPPQPAQPNPITSGASQTPSKKDEIFTLNQLSRSSKKRKASEVDVDVDGDTVHEADTNGTSVSLSASNPTNLSDAPLDAEAMTEEPTTKKAKKKAAKAAKKAEREAAAAQQPPTQPFDYANAESLLNPVGSGQKAPANGVKPMNPYAKALDTSTGARQAKMGKELAGKSMTFKS